MRRVGIPLLLTVVAWLGLGPERSNGLIGQTAGTSAVKKYTIDGREKLLYRPHIIYFGASQRIYGINWHSWGGKRAKGQAKFPYNDCVPYCAAGNITPYEVKVVLGRLHSCRGELAYLRLIFVFTNEKPLGPPRRTTVGQGYFC